jgi:hypothetical protein
MNSRSKLHEESLWICGGQADDESCLRHQAFWHSWQGPLLEGHKVTTSP